MSTQHATSIRDVIDAIGRNSKATDNVVDVGRALRMLYHDRLAELHTTIDAMLDDDEWSQDREPYIWLEAVQQEID